eukprot:scaffold129908_cov35-Prasinocladus_malaysianus.AAC.1
MARMTAADIISPRAAPPAIISIEANRLPWPTLSLGYDDEDGALLPGVSAHPCRVRADFVSLLREYGCN